MRSRQYRWPRVGPLLLLLVPLQGCGSDSRDTADTTPEWSLSAEPTLSIGSDSIPEEVFGQVGAALGLEDGRVAVLDSRAVEIRIFEPDGRYLRTLGRRGRGPGEFQAVDWIQRGEDSVIAHDVMLNTVAILALQDGGARMVTPEPDPEMRRPALAGWLTSGSWLGIVTPRANVERVVGMNQYRQQYVLLPPAADGATRLLAEIGGLILVETETLGTAPARFHRWTSMIPFGDRVAALDPDSGRVTLYRSDASMETSFAVPMKRRVLTTAMVAAALADETSRAESQESRASWEALYAAEPKPDSLPLFRTGYADGDRLLWMEAFWLDPRSPREFAVVRDDGALVGRLTTPAGFRLHAVGPDWILGVQEDADGVEQVVRYGLVRR